MYTERSQYRRWVAKIDREENNRHGEQIALSKLTTFINCQLAHTGMAGQENIGYRKAMMDVTGEILRLLREQQDD